MVVPPQRLEEGRDNRLPALGTLDIILQLGLLPATPLLHQTLEALKHSRFDFAFQVVAVQVQYLLRVDTILPGNIAKRFRPALRRVGAEALVELIVPLELASDANNVLTALGARAKLQAELQRAAELWSVAHDELLVPCWGEPVWSEGHPNRVALVEWEGFVLDAKAKEAQAGVLRQAHRFPRRHIIGDLALVHIDHDVRELCVLSRQAKPRDLERLPPLHEVVHSVRALLHLARLLFSLLLLLGRQ